MSAPFVAAAAQYPIEAPRDWAQYETRIAHWVAAAAAHGARLLLFPEYFSMELAALFAPPVQASLAAQLDALQELLPGFLRLFAAQARMHGVLICAGTFPVRVGGGFRNRCHLFHPDGRIDVQEKLQMTRFEREQWRIDAGDALRTFDSEVGRLGIAVCYDAEFPLLARRMVEQGADVILVPSCTDTLAGYWRVRIGCQARALENQCYVVHSATVGTAPWSAALDVNVGAAAVYAPVDRGFPDDGVLAIGRMNEPQWVYATLDPAKLAAVRRDGQVLNHRDWDAQRRFDA